MNGKKQRVLLAVSGGVDSSVTKLTCLREQVYDVVGVTMKVWPARIVSHKPKANAATRGHRG